MAQAIRQLFVRLGYFALSKGLELPTGTARLVADFADRSTLRDMLQRLKINVVLDVGANNGSFARNLRRLGYRGHIVSFEPDPAAFREMHRVLEADARWQGLNLGLGSEDTRKTFNIARLSNLSSFLKPVAGIVMSGTAEVHVRRLDSVLPELILPVEDLRIFLKVDTQGYDVEVIKGAAGCIDSVVGLQSEVSVQSIYEGMPHYLESLQLYESLGFHLIDLFPVSWGVYRNVIEYDCLMARLDRLSYS
jgi:FkbM family methyltransferase